jgi:FkbM family methyltransferase
MQAWRRLLGPGDLFVDVGSNVGVYALWAAERGAEVIAVEPDADAASRLRRNVALNGAEVEVLECALAAEPGMMTLTSGYGCTNRLIVDAANSMGTVRRVPVRTLDEIIRGRHVAGVKVDVEGAERLVLAGGERALSEQRIRILQLEWNRQSELTLGEDRKPVAEILRRHGYVLTRPDSDGRLLPAEPVGYCADLFAVADSAANETQLTVSK